MNSASTSTDDNVTIISVLSVNLLSFTGQLVNNQSQLQWKTANEMNTDYFEVDKSYDGIHFDSLTNVKAVGTSNNSYTTVDAYLQTGANYYRLKMFNNDGSYTYSDIVLIRVTGNVDNVPFIVYPNPVSKQLVAAYDNATINSILTIINSAGQKILSVPTNGQSKTTIEVSNLANGTYIIQYIGDSEILMKKFIKID
jgi:hypothetical protein